MVLSPPPRILVSFVISTHNRKAVLLETLARASACGLRADELELLIVDNASTDQTADAVEAAFPRARIFRQTENLGPVSKNIAIEEANGRYVVFLDDDSFPEPNSIKRMIRHFESDARLGAAVFRILLPDGSEECSAYPNVFIGCGTGFRRRALAQVGGLPTDFFMAAEEYDLSLRMLAAGWEIKRFEDICVRHLKTPGARFARRITRLDIRNNLLLIARYFPEPWVAPYVRDWIHRYFLISSNKGHRWDFLRGMAQGIAGGLQPSRRHPLSEEAFEKFSRISETRRLLAARASEHNLRRVLFIDLGKNIYAYWCAAHECGLEVTAIADPRLAGHGHRYRGVPIIRDQDARAIRYDAAIVSNLSPVHARTRLAQWQLATKVPVIDLFACQEETQFAARVA